MYACMYVCMYIYIYIYKYICIYIYIYTHSCDSCTARIRTRAAEARTDLLDTTTHQKRFE